MNLTSWRDFPTLLFASAMAASAFSLVDVACAEAAQVDGVKLVEIGLYSAAVAKKERAGTPSGVVLWQASVHLVEATTTICPEPGVVFGMRYIVEGTPKGEAVDILVKVKFPPPGMRYPGRPMVNSAEHVFVRNLGDVRFTSYTIGGAWDAIPGRWTIELWHGDQMLVEQGFDLDKKACPTS